MLLPTQGYIVDSQHSWATRIVGIRLGLQQPQECLWLIGTPALRQASATFPASLECERDQQLCRAVGPASVPGQLATDALPASAQGGRCPVACSVERTSAAPRPRLRVTRVRVGLGQPLFGGSVRTQPERIEFITGTVSTNAEQAERTIYCPMVQRQPRRLLPFVIWLVAGHHRPKDDSTIVPDHRSLEALAAEELGLHVRNRSIERDACRPGRDWRGQVIQLVRIGLVVRRVKGVKTLAQLVSDGDHAESLLQFDDLA